MASCKDFTSRFPIYLTCLKIRLLHGSSALVQYNETALQNLFVQSYKKAGVESRIKVHLARHMLGYHQEKMGYVGAMSESESAANLGFIY